MTFRIRDEPEFDDLHWHDAHVYGSCQNNNWISGQTLSNGATTAYTEDAKAQITQLLNKNGSGTVLSNFNSMTYDGVGNRTAADVTESSDTTYSGDTSFTYDNRNELTNETSTRNGSYNETNVFDPAENATTFKNASGHTFNSNNQRSNTGYAFDGNGNPSTYSSATTAFDVENRMTSYGTALTAGYDSNNMRSWKTDSTGTTYYLYADNSTSPVCELNSSGTVTATNTYTINGLVSRNTSSGSTFYEFDQSGNVSERLNSSGSCTSSSVTDAFGAVSNSSTISDPFGYVAQAGYYTDQATGLILTTFRYYDPANGRFINRDPSGYAGGINLYSYTQNNYEDRLDPLGYGGNGGGGGSAPPGGGGSASGSGGAHHHCPNSPCTPNPYVAGLWAGLAAVVTGAILAALVTASPGSLVIAAALGCIAGAVTGAVSTLVGEWAMHCFQSVNGEDLGLAAIAAVTGCLAGAAAGVIAKLGGNLWTTGIVNKIKTFLPKSPK
jgi:RHS repeat-associated protein